MRRNNKKQRFKKTKPCKKTKPRKFSRTILGLILFSGFLIIFIIFFNPWVWRLNLRKDLEESKKATTVFDRNGDAIVNLYAKTRLWVSLKKMPEFLQLAFVATEDSRFYKHKGIDIRGIGRAIYQDIKERRKAQGGSTITQQLVKNLFFSQEKKLARKLLEMAYALRIEQQYSKEQILEFYLNSIYLGHGAWGVQAAAEVYFGKSVSQLTLSECAVLAALAKSPEYYSPFRNPEKTTERRNLVLGIMKKQGYLSEEEVKEAKSERIDTLKNPGTVFTGAYFVDYVIDFLRQETPYSEQYLRTAGLKIYTTMDPRFQRVAEGVFEVLPNAGPNEWGIIQPQGALVALNPRNGEILALVGGRRFSAAHHNRSYQIHRQPGSAIKPFVFATALENGYTPESQIVDQPLEIPINGTVWRPQNYDNQYRGAISLRTALEESVNTVAVQLVQEIGVKKIFQLAKKMGLNSLISEGERNDQALAPLALGGLTRGVTLLELTAAYSGFANRGIYSKPFGVTRVYDRWGKLIYQGKVRQIPVIQEETATNLTSMMEGVIIRGTGVRAKPISGASGKTGTTNRNTNGWFIGFTVDVLAGVWIGNDQPNRSLIVNGSPIGSGTAAAIWGSFLRQVSNEAEQSGSLPSWLER